MALPENVEFARSVEAGNRDLTTVLIGRQNFYIGEWNSEQWKGRDEFVSLGSIWSQCMGIVNSHRERGLTALKRENRNRGPEGPSELRSRLMRVGQGLKAVAAGEQRVKQLRAAFERETQALPMLSPGSVHPITRAEIRHRLEGLEPARISALLQDPSDAIVVSLLDLPAELSPVPAETRDRLVRLSVERANPPQKLAELKALSEAIGVADGAVRAANAALQDGLTHADQRELAVISGEAA